jgi:agmatinase
VLNAVDLILREVGLAKMLSSSNLFLLLTALTSPSLAREIVFPPQNPLQIHVDSPTSPGPDSALRADKFAGLTTYANLPWVHCLSDSDNVEKYDIAVLGAPFDTSTTARPGARFGPTGIRW